MPESTSGYCSKPFEFIVQNARFYIHLDLLSNISAPLQKLTTGSMSEAKQGFAVLEDVDQGTFHRFCQWVYKGYYDAAEHIMEEPQADGRPLESSDGRQELGFIEEAEGELEEENIPEIVGVWEEPRAYLQTSEPVTEASASADWDFQLKNDRKSKKKKQKSSKHLKEAFINRRPSVRRTTINISPPRPNLHPTENYTPVFLCHAQLYVFAEQRDIQLLKALALEELHATLAIFTLYKERTGDIIELLRYSYANTNEDIRDADSMRSLLAHYVGFEMDVLMTDSEFSDLMIEDGGELLRDFMTMVEKRID